MTLARLPGLPLLAAALLMWPTLGLAHAGADGAAHHGVWAGLVHPFTGVDHLLAMCAVGVWSALALRRWRDALVAPLAFAGTVLLGAMASHRGLVVPGVEPMIATSLLVLGLMVASRASLGAAAGAGVAAVFAWFHGAAHGQELAGAASLAGMVVSTAALHAAGLALGVRLRQGPPWAVRGVGAGVALAGVALLVA